MPTWFSGLMDWPVAYNIFHGFVSGKKEWYLRQELQRRQHAEPLKVIDVGCGPGTNARLFQDKTRFDYLGLDINPDYIRQAVRKYRLAFECADITHGWNPGKRFDVVLINSVLHHLSDTEAAAVLSAAADCLDPAGRCLVMDMIYPDIRTIFNSVRRILIRLDRGKFCRRAAQLESLLTSNFRYQRVEIFYLKPFFIPLWEMRLYVCTSGPTELS